MNTSTNTSTLQNDDYNTYKKLEGLLYSVPRLNATLSNLKIVLADMETINVLPGASDNEKPSTPTFAINSSVESEVIRRDNLFKSPEYLSIQAKINAMDSKLSRTYNMVNALSEKDQLLIKLRYFEQKPVETVMDIMGYSSRRGFDKKRKSIIVHQLIPIYKDSFGY